MERAQTEIVATWGRGDNKAPGQPASQRIGRGGVRGGGEEKEKEKGKGEGKRRRREGEKEKKSLGLADISG